MTDDPLDGAAADAWRQSRRTAHVPADFHARVLAALPPLPAALPDRGRWLRFAALTAGGAWFVARLAGLFLVVSAS